MEKQPAFHLAFLVNDLEEAADFYCGVIGGRRGRDAPNWIDIDLHGHQLSLHKGDNLTPIQGYSEVDGHPVPMPHFGVVLEMSQWQALADKVSAADIEFVIEPYIRFKDQPGEQATMFFMDYCGNALEFKAFASIEQLFATD